MGCHESGLSDYQWCKANGVHPGTFYNWVSKLKKSGYTIPDSESRNKAIPLLQEVVKVNLVEQEVTRPEKMEQNVHFLASQNTVITPAAEILLGGATLRLFNGADPAVIDRITQCIGGRQHAW